MYIQASTFSQKCLVCVHIMRQYVAGLGFRGRNICINLCTVCPEKELRGLGWHNKPSGEHQIVIVIC